MTITLQPYVKIAFSSVKLALEIPGAALLVRIIELAQQPAFALAQTVETSQIRIGVVPAVLGLYVQSSQTITLR